MTSKDLKNPNRVSKFPNILKFHGDKVDMGKILLNFTIIYLGFQIFQVKLRTYGFTLQSFSF